MGGYDEVVADWRRKRIRSSADLDAAVNGKAITLAYHSVKLEEPSVTFHDTREIFEHGRVTGYTGDVRTLFSLRNARRGWELLLDAFEKRLPLEEGLVKRFHYALSEGTYDERRFLRGERPGEYKRGDYVTGRLEVGAPPEDVEEEMGELLGELVEIPEKQALTAAAYFHAKFENIHAFADGNGRVGRLLMNFFLVCHDHPVITIHEEDRKAYMESLESWDRSQELGPLQDFLRNQAVKTWEKRV